MKNLHSTFNTVFLLWPIALSAMLLACEGPSQPAQVAHARVQNEDTKILERALTLDPKTGSNTLDGSEAVSSLAKRGVFTGTALLRMDYSSYYVPKKNIQVLGYKLVYFEHEYMEEYAGCCVNSGNAVVLLTDSDTTQVENFAKINKCGVEKGEQIYIDDELFKLLNLSAEIIPRLVEVSCKEQYRID